MDPNDERVNNGLIYILNKSYDFSKRSIRRDLIYTIESIIFGVVGALSLDYDYAYNIASKFRKKYYPKSED